MWSLLKRKLGIKCRELSIQHLSRRSAYWSLCTYWSNWSLNAVMLFPTLFQEGWELRNTKLQGTTLPERKQETWCTWGFAPQREYYRKILQEKQRSTGGARCCLLAKSRHHQAVGRALHATRPFDSASHLSTSISSTSPAQKICCTSVRQVHCVMFYS